MSRKINKSAICVYKPGEKSAAGFVPPLAHYRPPIARFEKVAETLRLPIIEHVRGTVSKSLITGTARITERKGIVDELLIQIERSSELIGMEMTQQGPELYKINSKGKLEKLDIQEGGYTFLFNELSLEQRNGLRILDFWAKNGSRIFYMWLGKGTTVEKIGTVYPVLDSGPLSEITNVEEITRETKVVGVIVDNTNELVLRNPLRKLVIEPSTETQFSHPLASASISQNAEILNIAVKKENWGLKMDSAGIDLHTLVTARDSRIRISDRLIAFELSGLPGEYLEKMFSLINRRDILSIELFCLELTDEKSTKYSGTFRLVTSWKKITKKDEVAEMINKGNCVLGILTTDSALENKLENYESVTRVYGTF